MINAEYVMAVTCGKLSGKDLLHAEKQNNVIIIRRLEYDRQTNYFSDDKFITNGKNSPYKLMFIFDNAQAVIVRGAEDKLKVNRMLGIL